METKKKEIGVIIVGHVPFIGRQILDLLPDREICIVEDFSKAEITLPPSQGWIVPESLQKQAPIIIPDLVAELTVKEKGSNRAQRRKRERETKKKNKKR